MTKPTLAVMVAMSVACSLIALLFGPLAVLAFLAGMAVVINATV